MLVWNFWVMPFLTMFICVVVCSDVFLKFSVIVNQCLIFLIMPLLLLLLLLNLELMTRIRHNHCCYFRYYWVETFVSKLQCGNCCSQESVVIDNSCYDYKTQWVPGGSSIPLSEYVHLCSAVMVMWHDWWLWRYVRWRATCRLHRYDHRPIHCKYL